MQNKTNTLRSHNGESANSRVDKMSGSIYHKELVGKSKVSDKKFYSKKRRQFLKNINNQEKF